MPDITSLPVDAGNSPSSTEDTQAAKALANDENYCQIDTASLNADGGETAIFSDWDDIASGLPADSTITGLQALLPEMYGNVSQINMYLSIDAGSAYSSAEAVDLSGMTKSGDSSVTTPAGETDLWGLTWDPASLDWDDVWLKISVNGGTANRYFYFDYVQLKVFYSLPAATKVLTINGSVTVNGNLTIK